MSFRRVLIAIALGVAAAETATAQSALDLVPHDVDGASFFRSPAEMERKRALLPRTADTKLSKLTFEGLLKDFGLEGGVDGERPVAVFHVNRLRLHDKAVAKVLGVFVTDEPKVRAGLGLVQEIEPGIVRSVKAGKRWVLLNPGKVLYAGESGQAVQGLSEFHPLSKVLRPAVRRLCADADFGIYVAARFAQLMVGLNFPSHRLLQAGPKDGKLAGRIDDLVREVGSIGVGFSFDHGFHAKAWGEFPGSFDVLDALGGNRVPSRFIGLPDREFLVAFADKGGARDAAESAYFARVIAELTIGGDKTRYDKIEACLRRVRGLRAAVYRSTDATKFGRVVMAAIADVRTPQDADDAPRALAEALLLLMGGRPEWTLTADGTQRIGAVEATVLSIDPRGSSEEERAELSRAWGKDWTKVRVVAGDGRAAVFFGSDPVLPAETLDNLRVGRKGLESSPYMVADRHPARRFEVHVKAEALSPDADATRNPSRGFVSTLIVTIKSGLVLIDARVPNSEMPAWFDRGLSTFRF